MSRMSPLPSLLLVEDNRNIASALLEALRNTYEVHLVDSGKSAIYKTDSLDYDIIILDINLPDSSAMDICLQLRERGLKTPIMILSGEPGVLTKIKLLDAGANDYLTKPFSLGELKARLRVLIRVNKYLKAPLKESLSVGVLTLNRASHSVDRNGVDIILRRKEFALLECLMMNAGMVVSRTSLGDFAWEADDNLWTNTVDVHIKYLRDKIDRPFDFPLILTVHGIGYKLQTASAQVAKTTS
jgi:DNA-binding response OmpR family regulator